MNPWYTEYSDYLARLFPGVKVQKISVSSACTCPNRDGSIGRGGCIYCDNSTFTPAYALAGDDIATQIERGIRFFGRKYPDMRYLAYFQSFTATYGNLAEHARNWREALNDDRVVGLVVGTRPDCVADEVLDRLAEAADGKPLLMEFGAESMHDSTLRIINRGHSAACTADAVERAAKRGFSVGLHLIVGLPGERRPEVLDSIDRVCQLPIDVLKIHQIQVISGTELHRRFLEGKADLWPFSLDDYLALCAEIVMRVPSRIAIDRFLAQAPPDRVVSPKWGLKNYQFTHLLHNLLAKSVK